MTPRILKRVADPGLSARAMIRPNAGAGEIFAHLLLLPGIERGMPGGEAWHARLRADIGYVEPAAAIDTAGIRRSTAHLLAMHAVHSLALPPAKLREHRSRTAWRELNDRAVGVLLMAEMRGLVEAAASGGGDD